MRLIDPACTLTVITEAECYRTLRFMTHPPHFTAATCASFPPLMIKLPKWISWRHEQIPSSPWLLRIQEQELLSWAVSTSGETNSTRHELLSCIVLDASPQEHGQVIFWKGRTTRQAPMAVFTPDSSVDEPFLYFQLVRFAFTIYCVKQAKLIVKAVHAFPCVGTAPGTMKGNDTKTSEDKSSTSFFAKC